MFSNRKTKPISSLDILEKQLKISKDRELVLDLQYAELKLYGDDEDPNTRMRFNTIQDELNKIKEDIIKQEKGIMLQKEKLSEEAKRFSLPEKTKSGLEKGIRVKPALQHKKKTAP